MAQTKNTHKIPPLMGFAEVCECLGVRSGNLQFITDLPKPAAHVRATSLWVAADIRKFAKIYHARRAKRRTSAGLEAVEEAA